MRRSRQLAHLGAEIGSRDATSTHTRLVSRASLALLLAASACRTSSPVVAPEAPQEAVPKAAVVAPEDTLTPKLERLAERLEEARVENHVVGMAVAVVKDGGVVFARGFGHADLEAKKPATPRSVFAIGSSTKAFTATLIGMLVDEQRMSWDDPVEQYVPEFVLAADSKDGRKATLRDALSHRTGFTRMGILWASGDVPRNDFLAQASNGVPTAKLGEKFQYNNVAYTAAGEASARVAEMSWDELLESRLLQPLGMGHTTSSSAVALDSPNLAKGYRWREIGEKTEAVPMRPLEQIAPAGAINSNILDMTRWLRFQLADGVFEGQRLIAKDTLLETRKPQMKVAGKMQYGLGWFLDEWKGRAIVHHGGNIDGYSSMVGFLPAENIGFVMLSNASTTPLQGAVGGIIYDALLSEPKSPAGQVSEENLDVFAGVYVANFSKFKGEKFTVTVKDGALFVDVPGQQNFELAEPNDEGRRPFKLTDTVAVSFEGNEDGHATTLRLHQGGYDFEVFREGYMPAPERPLEQLEALRGFYEHDKLGRTEVKIRNNRLAIDIPGQMVYELHPPDAENRWAFRIKNTISIEFDSAEKPTKLTLRQGGKTFDYLRKKAKPAAAVPPLKLVLRWSSIQANQKKFAKLGTIEVRGRARFMQAGVEGTFTLYMVADGKSSFVLDTGRYGKLRVELRQKTGWEESDFAPLEMLEGKYLAQGLLAQTLAWSLNWPKTADVVKVVGEEKAGTLDAWEVTAKSGELPTFTLKIDKATGNVREVKYGALTTAGPVSSTDTFSDFRSVLGLRLPHRIERTTGPSGTIRLDIDSVSAVPKGGDSVFPSKPTE